MAASLRLANGVSDGGGCPGNAARSTLYKCVDHRLGTRRSVQCVSVCTRCKAEQAADAGDVHKRDITSVGFGTKLVEEWGSGDVQPDTIARVLFSLLTTPAQPQRMSTYMFIVLRRHPFYAFVASWHGCSASGSGVFVATSASLTRRHPERCGNASDREPRPFHACQRKSGVLTCPRMVQGVGGDATIHVLGRATHESLNPSLLQESGEERKLEALKTGRVARQGSEIVLSEGDRPVGSQADAVEPKSRLCAREELGGAGSCTCDSGDSKQ
jgi:hypothetical protein